MDYDHYNHELYLSDSNSNSFLTLNKDFNTINKVYLKKYEKCEKMKKN